MDPVTVTMVATTVASLAKEYGPKVGRFIGDQINKDKDKTKVFLSDIAAGLGASDSLKKIFGDELPKLLEKAKKAKKIQYESNCNQYIALDIDKNLSIDKQNDLLKAELAENLERLNASNTDEQINNARMITNQWMRKFVQVKNPDNNTIQKLKALEEILKPGKTNGKDIFKKLKPLFGFASVLSLIAAAILATGAGMGAFVAINYFLMGVPFGQVLGAIGLAGIMAYLALVPVKDEAKIQIVINGMYGIIDENIEDISDILKRENLKQKDEDLLKELQKKLESQCVSNSEIIMIIALLKHMVLVDGHENDAEVYILKEYLKIHIGMNDDEVKSMYENAPEIEDINSLISDLKEHLSIEDKEKLLTTLKEIAVADKKLDPREVSLLKEIMEIFKIGGEK